MHKNSALKCGIFVCIFFVNATWSECGDSNPGPPAPKAGALPTAQHPVLFLCGPGTGAHISIIHIFSQMSNVQKFYGDFFLRLEYNTHIILYWRNIP